MILEILSETLEKTSKDRLKQISEWQTCDLVTFNGDAGDAEIMKL